MASQPPWGAQSPRPHAYMVHPSERKSLRGLVTALTALFSVFAVLLLVSAGGYFSRGSLLAATAEGRYYTVEQADLVDGVVVATDVLYLVLFVPAAVVFLIWQYRHAQNARALGAERRMGPGWVVGGWFIPFANFVLPAVQIFQASKESNAQPPHHGRHGRGATIVVPWMILYALGTALNLVALGLWPVYVETPQEFEAASLSDYIGGLGALVLSAAAVVAALMVRSLSKRQDEAFAARGRAEPVLGDPALGYAGQPAGYPATGQPPAGMPWTAQPPAFGQASAPPESTPSVEPDPNHDPWRSPPA